MVDYIDLEGMDELYDLRTEAFEMNNLIAAPGAQVPLKDLKAELQRLLRESTFGNRSKPSDLQLASRAVCSRQ